MTKKVRSYRNPNWLLKRLLRKLGGQSGALLMEVTVTLAVFGVLGSAVMGAVQTSNVSKTYVDVEATAESLILNQMSYILEQPYKAPGEDYDTISLPSGYTLDVDTLTHDVSSTEIEKIRITVYQEGKLIEIHEELRANR